MAVLEESSTDSFPTTPMNIHQTKVIFSPTQQIKNILVLPKTEKKKSAEKQGKKVIKSVLKQIPCKGWGSKQIPTQTVSSKKQYLQ